MAICLSRRACPDKVAFRLLKNGKQKFTIFTEYRCPNQIERGSKVCEECSKKLPMYKYQANQKCDHGFIGGPYPKDSKLYGSPYYLKCIKDGCTISEVDEQRAKEAMTNSGSEMPKKTATATLAGAVTVTKAEKKPAKKVIKVKSSIPVLETPIAITDQHTSPNILAVALVKPTMVESTETPIIVEDIIHVKVKKIRHQGKDYYFDGNSGKVYNATTNGVGKYAGRYNDETATLNVSYPDSDNE